MKLLTSKEVAALLGVQPNTLKLWRYHGKGPKFLKIRNMVRYNQDEVEKWIREQNK